MQIGTYYIPLKLHENEFVKSLSSQFEKTGRLSQKQLNALEDILEIDVDFFGSDYEIADLDFELLLAKYKRNRFKNIWTRNRCVRAMNSIINGNKNQELVDLALNKNFSRY